MVIGSDETTVWAYCQMKYIYYKVHHSTKRENLPVNGQIRTSSFSVKFWGCFSKLSLGPLLTLEGLMTSPKYEEMLKYVLLPELEAAGVPMIFMQDNAPCQKVK